MSDSYGDDEESEVEKEMGNWLDDDYSSPVLPTPIQKLPTDQKLDKIYHILNHIRWMMLGFILVTIIVPLILANL